MMKDGLVSVVAACWIMAVLCGCQSMNYEQGLKHYREEQQVHIQSYGEWLQEHNQ